MRVAVYGTGVTAAALAQHMQEGEFELAAVVAHSPAKMGVAFSELNPEAPEGVTTVGDLDGVLASGDVDVLMYTGLGGDAMVDAMRSALGNGVDFITPVFISPQLALGAEVVSELDDIARAHDARLLGTGLNPGMVLDVLPAVMAAALRPPLELHARRVTDISVWGRQVLLDEVGIGMEAGTAPARFDGALTESLYVFAEAIGLDLTGVGRSGGESLAEAPAECQGIEVNAGAVIGFDQTVTGRSEDGSTLELRWIGLPDPAPGGLETGVYLELRGACGDRIAATVEAPHSYLGTAARMINSIRPLRSLPPGLYTPAAIHGAFRPGQAPSREHQTR
jgi:hypothetical protein